MRRPKFSQIMTWKYYLAKYHIMNISNDDLRYLSEVLKSRHVKQALTVV